jgi:gliding motility-associated protein GldL
MKPGSKRWKQFMAKLYGIGAAIVIVGALFKIEHWPMASALLIVGLSTEAVIFFFSAFEPPHEEPDWSLVYPELATGEHDEHSTSNQSLTEQLDGMLEDAKIEPELIASLGEGMRNLSTSANNLNQMGDAAGATKEYGESLRNASDRVNQLSDTYEQTAESLTGIKDNAEATSAAGEHLSKMSENLQQLNGMYELQLVELEKSRQMYAGMTDLVQSLNESVDDTRLYKENIAELAKNLQSLNTVYNNMLNAMSGGVQQNA